MNNNNRLHFLEERADFLEREKNDTLKALENVIEVDDLTASLNKLKKNSDLIIDKAYDKVSNLIKIKSAGFLLVEENSGLFSPAWFHPEDCREEILSETDNLIMDNTFALAIKANRCFTVKSKALKGTLLVHALSTVSRTRGMFICLLDMNKEDVPDAVFSLITIIMNSTAHLLESYELYNRNRISNELLSKSVKRLEQSEVHLKSFNEKLEAEVNSRTKELKATNDLLENEIGERKKIEKLLIQQKDALENLNQTLENRVMVETENRRKSEQVMHEQSKLAAMGQMLTAISHQWRQPLNTLGLVIQDMLDEHAEKGISDEYLQEAVGKAVKLILHMSSTIDDFCDLVKSDGTDTHFNIYEAVQEVTALVEEHYSELGIFIERLKSAEQDSSDLIVTGDQGVFKQVMLNLLANSKDAISARLDSGKISRGTISINIQLDGENIIVEVVDNGGGVSEKIMARIFEPYFTTKDPSTGTGIGLYMSKIFIEEHMNGKVSVSNTGDGASLKIQIAKVSL